MWKSIKNYPPPIDKWIYTKISDENGDRNEQCMKFDGKLWWVGDTYVYYAPTHWYKY